MYTETYKHFKYEIALDQAIPMPKPALDYFTNYQYSVQQYLYALCKMHVGSLGKKEGKWSFGEDAPPTVKLASRPEIVQIFEFAEKMGVIEPASSESPAGEGQFIPYKLTQAYWDKFDKYAQ